MGFTYLSGEEIQIGDRITLFEKPGRIEIVVDGPSSEASMNWYWTEFGCGIRIGEHGEFGRLFIRADSLNADGYDCNNLKFVTRGE
jgi:hypothetical protein